MPQGHRRTRRINHARVQHRRRETEYVAKVSREEYDHVMDRDRECIAVLLFRAGKVRFDPCRNAFGEPWSPRDGLTIEHVLLEPRIGKRASSVRRQMVASCAGHNWGTYWCSANRDAIRERLAALYPE